MGSVKVYKNMQVSIRLLGRKYIGFQDLLQLIASAVAIVK
tara:strand:- start:3616 stop:3735 length:120 start_codon:yes stop_codon:yes gene_type:complete